MLNSNRCCTQSFFLVEYSVHYQICGSHSKVSIALACSPVYSVRMFDEDDNDSDENSSFFDDGDVQMEEVPQPLPHVTHPEAVGTECWTLRQLLTMEEDVEDQSLLPGKSDINYLVGQLYDRFHAGEGVPLHETFGFLRRAFMFQPIALDNMQYEENVSQYTVADGRKWTCCACLLPEHKLELQDRALVNKLEQLLQAQRRPGLPLCMSEDEWLFVFRQMTVQSLYTHHVVKLSNGQFYEPLHELPFESKPMTFCDLYDRVMVFHRATRRLSRALEMDLSLQPWTGTGDEPNWHDVVQKLQKVRSIVYFASKFCATHGTMYRLIHSGHASASDESCGERSASREQQPADDHEAFQGTIMVPKHSEILNNECAKMTNWQKVILFLYEQLPKYNYRRANGKFFSLVSSQTYDMLAYEEKESVEDWVYFYTDYIRFHDVWCWASNPPSNVTSCINEFKTRPLAEAPDLKENYALRSYAGDAVGRGSVVYCSQSDFAFPYRERSNWAQIARNVLASRKFLGLKLPCVAPSPDDVCIRHLDAAFPYDTIHETNVITRRGTDYIRFWYESDEFACRPENTTFIDNPQLAKHIADNIQPRSTTLKDVVGIRWMRVERPIEPPCDFLELLCKDSAALDAFKKTVGDICEFDAPPVFLGFEHRPFPYNSYCRTDSGYFVPLLDPGQQPRVQVDTTTWLRLCGDSAIYNHRSVLVHNKRFFRIDIGRTWNECDVAEIDHIYDCQKFTLYDRFMLYAMKGRTLFEVGERDTFQLTLLLEGIGGCGKTTVLMTHSKFFPLHLIGVLTSNIEPQFGMSQVMREGNARLIRCNEVSSDLNLKQEEWQDSMDALATSYAVKFKNAFVGRNKAQHFWVGNAFPKCFKNDQGQVSRRLAGVLMQYPIKKRDSSIAQKLNAKMGNLQRKEVLAYNSFVDIYCTTDPWSPEMISLLPPAFRTYYERGRRMTNPLEDFLGDKKYIIIDHTQSMLLSTFKNLYKDYTQEHQLKSSRLTEEMWRTPFNEKGIRMVHEKNTITLNNQSYTDVDIVIGVCEAKS